MEFHNPRPRHFARAAARLLPGVARAIYDHGPNAYTAFEMARSATAGSVSTPKRVRYNAPNTATLKRIVRKQITASHELRTYANGQTTTPTAVAANMYLVNGVAQGTGAAQRIGRDMKNKSIELGLKIQFNQTAARSESVRVVFIFDKESRGAAITAPDVLYANDIGQVFNADNYHRFIILSDRTFNGPPAGYPTNGTSVGSTDQVFHYKINCRGLVTHYYDNSTGVITSIDSGAIYMMTMSMNGDAAVTSAYTLKYTDP